jgi:hypothetical protein
MAIMTNKTLFAVIASLGLGLLPLGVIALTGCGDNNTEANPFDAGSDAAKEAAADAASDAAKDSGTDSGSDAAKDSGAADAPTDAPTDGG